MTRAAFLCVALLALGTSCSPTDPTTSRKSAGQGQLDDQFAADPVGQWKLAGLDGKPWPASAYPVRIAIADNWIHATSQCVWYRWTWMRNGETGFSARRTTFLSRSEPGEEPSPVPMCARGLSPDEKSFEQAIEQAKTLAFVNPNKITLGQLALERLPDIEGRWDVESLSGQQLTRKDYPINAAIENDEIYAASQCVWWKWRYRITGEQLVLKRIEENVPICERSRAATEDQFEKALQGAMTAKLDRNRSLLISGPSGSVKFRIGP